MKTFSAGTSKEDLQTSVLAEYLPKDYFSASAGVNFMKLRLHGEKHEKTEEGDDYSKRRQEFPSRFQSKLLTFQQMMNVPSSFVPLAHAFEEIAPYLSRENFRLELDKLSLDITYRMYIWYDNIDVHPGFNTRSSINFSFAAAHLIKYVFRGVHPATALQLQPSSAREGSEHFMDSRHLFTVTSRSNFTWKTALSKNMDFSSVHFGRIFDNDRLTRVITTCQELLQRPISLVYWLMIMVGPSVGSYYRESLVEMHALPPISPELVTAAQEKVPLRALTKLEEFEHWLGETMERPGTTRSMRGMGKADRDTHGGAEGDRERQDRDRDEKHALFAGEFPSQTYVEAVRLFCATNSLGIHSDGEFFCANGRDTCDVAVPFPHTASCFLCPFVKAVPVATTCRLHRPLTEEEKLTARQTGGGRLVPPFFALEGPRGERLRSLCTCRLHIPTPTQLSIPPRKRNSTEKNQEEREKQTGQGQEGSSNNIELSERAQQRREKFYEKQRQETWLRTYENLQSGCALMEYAQIYELSEQVVQDNILDHLGLIRDVRKVLG
uniref:Uncharacterized protein n=1 Tax=Chromera velia CCMP2878 TaxID=1169474 RepID=A0A0G4HLK8_9ALVE|eukprot:Cvel_28773.t1-p1 / transcript=Cvel_28773.t1 / gene=Cvel_28773 / organism=Chromera_velia_CCMP2878 / gene_product=hypothetical protein / transcript_product=hypothetical protein / location=Cvel_scaffold3829:6924-13097(+) / protein_length=550 / sequence_SO=supercontig / SO=protein_coding / is_pseudo=false